MAAVLKEANCSLPLSLTPSVNRNGAVTLTANPYTPSSAYSPFFDAMTKKLNQSFPVGDNPFQVFREAPTSVELLIHNLPLSILPQEPTNLFPSLLESISNAIDVPIFGATFLQSDPVKRAEKRTTSVVVAVDPLHVSRFGESIRLFSRARTVAPAYSACKSTQCRKCWRFGHSAPLCKKRHKLARSALSSITAPPTDVLTRAAQKGALRSRSWVAATPHTVSVSTVVVSTPLSMAPVPSAANSSPLSVLLGTKTFPMPPMWAPPKPPLRVKLFTQLYWLLQPDAVLVSLPLANLPNLKRLKWFAALPPTQALPPPSPAETSFVQAAPSSELAPGPTGASPCRPTSTWIFRCREAQPQHRVLHHLNHSIILVV